MKKLVGFAILGEDPLIDFQILPEVEWRGIEEEAFAWAEAWVVDLRKQNGKLWGGNRVSGARHGYLEQIDLLERYGFTCPGDFSEVMMVWSFSEQIPKPRYPKGVGHRHSFIRGGFSQTGAIGMFTLLERHGNEPCLHLHGFLRSSCEAMLSIHWL